MVLRPLLSTQNTIRNLCAYWTKSNGPTFWDVFSCVGERLSVNLILMIAKSSSWTLPHWLISYLKEYDISLFWPPLGHMPSTSRSTLCTWWCLVKYREHRISCFYCFVDPFVFFTSTETSLQWSYRLLAGYLQCKVRLMHFMVLLYRIWRSVSRLLLSVEAIPIASFFFW